MEFAAHGGAFPIYVRGTGAVATVTVSGLPQKADHELVVEALSEILGRPGRRDARPASPRRTPGAIAAPAG